MHSLLFNIWNFTTCVALAIFLEYYPDVMHGWRQYARTRYDISPFAYLTKYFVQAQLLSTRHGKLSREQEQN